MRRLYCRKGTHMKTEQLLKDGAKDHRCIGDCHHNCRKTNCFYCVIAISWLILPRMVVLIDCVVQFCPFSMNRI